MATASPSSASNRTGSAPSTRLERERGQLSPTAALVAVASIGLGLSLYATVFAGVAPLSDRTVAEPTLERVHSTVVAAGVADPARLNQAAAAGPNGYQLRVSLWLEHQHWTVGPTPPTNGVQTASRQTAVRTGPGRVRTGRLRVVVWR